MNSGKCSLMVWPMASISKRSMYSVMKPIITGPDTQAALRKEPTRPSRSRWPVEAYDYLNPGACSALEDHSPQQRRASRRLHLDLTPEASRESCEETPPTPHPPPQRLTTKTSPQPLSASRPDEPPTDETPPNTVMPQHRPLPKTRTQTKPGYRTECVGGG